MGRTRVTNTAIAYHDRNGSDLVKSGFPGVGGVPHINVTHEKERRVMANGKPGAPRIEPQMNEFREWLDKQYQRKNPASVVSNARMYLQFLDECDVWPPEMVAALEKRIEKLIDQSMKEQM